MLPLKNRLTKKSDFENVRQNGRFITSKYFSASCVKRDKEELPSRFGFIVSKKISMKSHDRNRVKRILREIVQSNIDEVEKGFDFVIIAKSGITQVDRDKLETDLKKEILC